MGDFSAVGERRFVAESDEDGADFIFDNSLEAGAVSEIRKGEVQVQPGQSQLLPQAPASRIAGQFPRSRMPATGV